ncbi:MAG: hypothetical protein JRJ42_03585 [Deltaproteobacteria bacterium]|nr:hypothetical protein [Deltaproteobacteria bacterium]
MIRKKWPYVFPVFSIGYCMDYFGLTSLDQIDFLITDNIRIRRWFNSGPSYNISEYDYLKIKFDIDPRKIQTINHHEAHAAGAYYASGFDEAAILVVDGNGSDLETTSYFYGKGDSLSLLENYKYHGIGICYTVVTNFILGFGTGGEGKTMGLAPYGEGKKRVLNINTELNGIKNNLSSFMSRMPYSDVLNQMDSRNRIYPLKSYFPKCEKKEDLLNPYYSRIAYDVQKETERVMIHLARDLYAKTKIKNLCISGGVGLNSVSNKMILDKCEFENVFIFPACSDAGIPFGLALWGYYNCKEFGNFPRKKIVFRNAYTGIEYSDEHIASVLTTYDIPYSEVKLDQVARLISEGKIVGWFQGGSEYGPRALGHRSILADSRDKRMKDILNSKVKHREAFRPFAPAILKEYCSEYFDLECESPFMLLVAKVKNPDVIPAVTHVDNTGRVQTVTKEDNGSFYDLIKAFYNITGVPCILNTSFNDSGEPIVETPVDALICFLSTEMDYLVLGKYLVEAESINKHSIAVRMIDDRRKKISDRREELYNKYFKGYDVRERDYFIAESNKISEWHAKYRCKYELEKKVLTWIQNGTKILIVGTKDHTQILLKYINSFYQVNVVGFCSYKDGFERSRGVNILYHEYEIGKIKDIDFDEILISSYEYNFEIWELLSKNITKPLYMIYDNSSRNLMDVFKEFPEYKIRHEIEELHRMAEDLQWTNRLNAREVEWKYLKKYGKKYIKYREKWNRAGKKYLPEYPINLDFEVMDACNLRCRHCFRNREIAEKMKLVVNTGARFPLDDFKNVMAESAKYGLEAVNFGFSGECLLNDDLIKMIQMA